MKDSTLREHTIKAVQEGCRPLFQIEIGNQQYALLPWHYFEEYMKDDESDV